MTGNRSSFAALAFLGRKVDRANVEDRQHFCHDEEYWNLVLHIRQDLKLISFLLSGIFVMIAVIGDVLLFHR